MGFPTAVGEQIWWEESRPHEGGRTTVMRRDADGTTTELLGAPWSARTRVHEYGGRSYLPVPRRDDKAITRHGIVFANFTDQRLYLLDKGAKKPRPLTPEPASAGALRYADLALSPDGKRIICVQESHGENGRPTRSIVSLPLSGRAAEDADAITELVTGADFYASPLPSPDGRHLAWIAWNHPRMPWDGTELRVGALDKNGVNGAYTLKGGVNESVLFPAWRDNTHLYFVSDWPGWWNLYEIGLTGQAIALYPAEEEFAGGFALGTQPYRQLDDGRLVALHGHADLRPSIYDPDTAALTPVSTALNTWQTLSTNGHAIVALAAGPGTPQSLVRLNPDSGRVDTLRSSRADLPGAAYLPKARPTTMSGRYGSTVHANVYPPANPHVTGEGPAPYVVWVHGGPVAHATTEPDLAKAYFTSRGIGIIDVNYGGSTGYGRTYRKRLQQQWGVVDVEDVTAAAQALVDEGKADPERLAVRGGSAGGLTTLLALGGDMFACGTSLYGVTDLLRLAEKTHDFESHFLDSLIGPLPGYWATYRERSPINRVEDVDVPVLLLQGSQDLVVPPSQATAFATSLAERGIRHAYIEFEGEGHGFRTDEARQRALEAELAFYGEIFGFTPPDVPGIELVTEPPRSEPDPEPDLVAEPLPPLEAKDPSDTAEQPVPARPTETRASGEAPAAEQA